MKRSHFPSLLIGVAIACSPASPPSDPLNYPQARKVDTTDLYFGEVVADPYRWLEDDRSEETAQWVNAENKVTQAYLSHIPYRDTLAARLKALFDYERVSAPERHGDWEYFYKNDGLQNQSVLYRRKNRSDEAEVFLDPNQFSKDGTISLAEAAFTPDGSLMGYMLSTGGSDWRKVLVMNAETKSLVGDTLFNVKFSGLSWKGTQGFYYSSYDKPKEGSALSGKTQFHKLYYHQLGTPQASDKLVFGGESQPFRYIFGTVSEDGRYLSITASSSTSGNSLFIQDLSTSDSPILSIDENEDTEEHVITTDDSRILIETNQNAPNKKVVVTTIEAPSSDSWTDLIPETQNVLSTSTGSGFLFTSYLQDAKTMIRQYDLQGKHLRDVELPGIGTAYGISGQQEDRELYYTFTSFTYPATTFQYDPSTGKSTLYEQPKVDFNPEDYITEQVFFPSKDGTQIPMFIVYKKGIEKNGKNPTYLYAYGGFNISLTPSFSTSRILWLENGGIYAQPSLRGGGEYGEEWHKAGTKMNKQNVFDDFIAAGEYLIQEKYTSPDYLAIAGGSNGGLLIGATMTQRPDLAKVAFPAVGVLDMLRYHKFTSGAGWKSDYGTAEDSKEMFDYLLGYSPLHNLKPETHYPATMITTADHDDRVVPAHSFKFAATLQSDQAGDNPVLIRIETDAGHGAGTPISKTIEQEADKYAFAWYNMGVIPEVAKKDL